MTAGRPLIMTSEAIQKLEAAFAMGCTDLEACLLAKIGKSTLYSYQKENPKFLERKELLKETPIMLARESVIKAMKEDGNLALKYLERKKKDEFSLRSEMDISQGKNEDGERTWKVEVTHVEKGKK